jgi:hypothetical protein
LKTLLATVGRYLLGLLCVLLAGLLLSPFFRPSTTAGWLLVVPVLLVLGVVAEGAFQGVFSAEFGAGVSTSPFSLRRVLLALLLALPVFGACIFFTLLAGGR